MKVGNKEDGMLVPVVSRYWITSHYHGWVATYLPRGSGFGYNLFLDSRTSTITNSMLLDISVKKGDVFLSKKPQTVQPKTPPICAHLFLRWLSFYIWHAHCQLTIFTLVVGTAVCHYQVTSLVYTFLWYFILRNELWESLLWSDLLI